MEILKLREHSELASEAAEWFHSKWDIPVEEYAGSIQVLQSRTGKLSAVLGSSKTIFITARI